MPLLLTWRPAFKRDNVSDILARVLERDPDWSRVPSNVPASIHRVMRLCLEKDPRKRSGMLMAVPITTTGSAFEAERPMVLFPTDITAQPFESQYTVTRDGRCIVNNLQAEARCRPSR